MNVNCRGLHITERTDNFGRHSWHAQLGEVFSGARKIHS